MKTLAIDTANQVLGVALFQDKDLIGQYVTNLKKNHSVRLMPAINQLMEGTGTTPDELGKIAVSKGPGSYTGIRIGLSTAKTFAWALNIPIVGVSSLEVLSYQGRFYDGCVCPFFDARRNNVFTGLYHWKNNKMELIRDEQNVSMEDWLHALKSLNRPVLFLSPDIDRYHDQIDMIMEDHAIIPVGDCHMANPSHLVLAANSKPFDDTHTLTPNYLRLAEAEAKWIQSQKRSEG